MYHLLIPFSVTFWNFFFACQRSFTAFLSQLFITKWASLVVQTVKNLPAMQENQVQSLGGKTPLEKGMTTHSGILAWRIPWTEELGELQSTGLQRVRHY